MRWVVFEPAVVGRVVRRRDDHPVGRTRRTAPVMGQNGVGNDRGRRVAAPALDPDLHPVRREDLEGRDEGRLGEGMGVDAEKEGAGDPLGPPVLRRRLGDRQDVILVKGALVRDPPVARRPERHQLVLVGRVRVHGEIVADEPGNVDDERGRDWHAGERMQTHGPSGRRAGCKKGSGGAPAVHRGARQHPGEASIGRRPTRRQAENLRSKPDAAGRAFGGAPTSGARDQGRPMNFRAFR